MICSVASALGLFLLPLLAVKDLKLTDEQLTETRGFKLSNYVELGALPIALVALVLYFCYANIISFLALYSQEVRLTGAANFFFLLCAAAMLVTRPFVGRLFDAKGENAVIYPALPLFALGIAVFSQARAGYVLLLAAFVIGLGFGAVQTSGQTIAVKITPPHRAGLATSTFYMFADIGAGMGPLLCGLVIPFAGYRGMYLAVAAVAAGGGADDGRCGRRPAGGHQPRCRILGGDDLHRQRAELHGEGDRRAGGREDAELLRLHPLQPRRAAAGVRGHVVPVPVT